MVNRGNLGIKNNENIKADYVIKNISEFTENILRISYMRNLEIYNY